MHSVGRYLQSPSLFQSLYRYFRTNLAPDNVLKIDPLLSIPSKSHTTDILIFWKVCSCILDYWFSVVCCSKGRGQMCSGWMRFTILRDSLLQGQLSKPRHCYRSSQPWPRGAPLPWVWSNRSQKEVLTSTKTTSKIIQYINVENKQDFCVLATAMNCTEPLCSYPLGSKYVGFFKKKKVFLPQG